MAAARRFNPGETPGPSVDPVFENYSVATWQVGSSPLIAFPIVGQLGEDFGNRIVRHPRPYRRGAKLDSTGAKEREFQVTALFNNTIRESGLSSSRALYPFVLRDLVNSFALQETGTLTLPTVGAVRCRAESGKRIEDVAARHEATLQLVFVEDNEDALARASFAPPTVRASVTKQAEQTKFSGDRSGAHDADLPNLFQLSTEIESLLLAPGRSLADLQGKVRSNRAAMQRILGAQEQLADDVDGETNDPRGSEFYRNLIRLLDNQARAADEKFASRPRVKSFVVDVDHTSVFEVAARFKQDAGELLDLNSERIADPFNLERGDVVRVFETPAV